MISYFPGVQILIWIGMIMYYNLGKDNNEA